MNKEYKSNLENYNNMIFSMESDLSENTWDLQRFEKPQAYGIGQPDYDYKQRNIEIRYLKKRYIQRRIESQSSLC